jgi:hypothetical protein
MGKIRISERKLILFTVGLLIVAGLVRLGFYKVGVWLFYLAFVPMILHRLSFYIRNRQKLHKADRYRRFTLGFIVATIILNLLGFQDVEFVLLIVLAIDYLIVVQNPRVTSGRE